MTEGNMNDVKQSSESDWTDKVGEAVKNIVRDKGIVIVNEPKTVIRAAPIIENKRITGGKLVIEIEF
ncbi:MAG: hypothetical protein OXF97_11415 [Nitrospira sp.]|nr:hypothetical protein [Nitrospira sp.]